MTKRAPCAHGYWFGHCPFCTQRAWEFVSGWLLQGDKAEQ